MDVDGRAGGRAGAGLFWQPGLEEFSLRGEAGRSLDAGCGDCAVAGERVGGGLLAGAAGGDGRSHGGTSRGVSLTSTLWGLPQAESDIKLPNSDRGSRAGDVEQPRGRRRLLFNKAVFALRLNIPAGQSLP